MDIMMRLKGAGFSAIANAFREREQRLGGGLPLLDFVEIVLRGLPRAKTAADKAASVSALVDLFEDIDINGDGAMEFDEFTSFCVDAGMVATRAQAATLKHRYVRDAKRALKTSAAAAVPATSSSTSTNGSSVGTSSASPPSTGVDKIKWSPGFRKFLVLENAARVVKVFSSEGKFVAEVGVAAEQQTPAQSQSQSHSSVTSSSGAGGAPLDVVDSVIPVAASSSGVPPAPPAASVFILDAVFIHRFQWLATSTTDFSISFYDMSESRSALSTPSATSGASFALLRRLGLTTPTAQLMLRFCEASALLVGSGNDFVVNVWHVLDADTKQLKWRLAAHTDLVLDVLEVPPHDLLVSCDLRRGIQLWDVANGRSRGALVGHAHGVRQLCYSAQHDLLLSAGFEFEALAWDLGSRRVALKLSGHRAPLVGVQLALFQTERAITADCQGVFKVWDISRGHASSSNAGGGGGASQAVQLESVDLAMPFARVEPSAFVSLHPHSRDLWVATTGSATLQHLRSARVQQFDEVPLRAFYHYAANKFVVVAGSVCSLWDGETGACTEEFTHVGNLGLAVSAPAGSEAQTLSASSPSRSGAGTAGSKTAASSSTTPANATAASGRPSSSSSESGTELLACVQDAKCKKLVVVSELGALGVFNCLNFVQMRRCQESFLGRPRVSGSGSSTSGAAPSCGVVGLHYCSENKLVVVTDAAASAIVVIDDNSNHDSARGAKEIGVLRRLVNIPSGIAASAYGFHASMVATVAAEGDAMRVSLWDFETLAFLADVRYDQDKSPPSSTASKPPTGGGSMQVLEFWDEFPVLLGADSLGGVYFFAVMPLLHAYTGKLLHAFANDHERRVTRSAASEATATATATSKPRAGKPSFSTSCIPESSNENPEEDEEEEEENAKEKPTAAEAPPQDAAFITQVTEQAARKMLLSTRHFRKNAVTSDTPVPSESRQTKQPTKPPLASSAAATCLKMVLDEANERHLLFVGDEHGCVSVWDPAGMTRRLALAKIPEIKCKFLRRGYHPKAMFSRDFAKEASEGGGKTSSSNQQRHRQAVVHGAGSGSEDWRGAMLLGKDMEQMNIRATQMDLKRLSRRRLETRKQRTAGNLQNGGTPKAQQSEQSKAKAKEAAVVNAVAAAECFLGKSAPQPRRRSILGPTSTPAGADAAPTASWPGAECYESFPDDVALLRRWKAHDNALTSLEISRHPDILVTCGVDMRVFVWDWNGVCLGKLFDPENRGPWTWRFRKDDATRVRERQQVVRDLLRELERSPSEKLERRRETLYAEHVGRRSVSELRNVNAMLLEHIISKNPELELMERELKAKNSVAIASGAAAAATDGIKPRHTRGKLTALQALALPPPKSEPPAPTLSQPQSLRLQSLSQPADLKMDKAYLEQELSITCPTPSGGSTSTSAARNADVQQQIHAEYLSAQQAVASRATLERKAREMYTNLEGVRLRRGPRPLPSSSKAQASGVEAEGDPLEPSDFLKRNLPASALALRPQTAPVRGLSGSISAGHVGLLRQRAETRQLKASASEAPLQTAKGSQRRGSGGASSAGSHRKHSLDMLYIEEYQRHHAQQHAPQHAAADQEVGNSEEAGSVEVATGEKQPPRPLQKLRGINDIIAKAQDFCDWSANEAQHHRPGSSPSGPRRKSSLLLTAPAIGVLSEKNYEMVAQSLASKDPIADPKTVEQSKPRETEADMLRRHLEGTKQRMQEAMRDGERAPHRRDLRRRRQRAQQQQQKRRMEGYLQQKRRELTTNIGNVFKGLQTAHDEDEDDETEIVEPGEEAAASGNREPKPKSPSARTPSKGKPQSAKATATATASASSSDSPVAQPNKKAFGIYSVREVMSVIRLFWSMDADGSGNISLTELLQYSHFFEKLGYHDMAAVFQAIDSDGDGQVSLRELLEICFHYATKYQLEEMLQLAKVGSVRSYFQGIHGPVTAHGGSSPTTAASGSTVILSAEHRNELKQIFRVFDRNGDGGVSMQEIMEALRVDDDDVMAAVMTREHERRGHDPVVSSGLTRDDVEKLYREFDTDQSATLEFDEFVLLMQSLYAPKPRHL